MKSLKYSLSIKTLCYILTPILLVMLIASVFSILYVTENPDIMKTEQFTQTEQFIDLYYGELNTISNQIKSNIGNYGITVLEKNFVEENGIRKAKTIYYYPSYDVVIDYIIEKSNSEVYTNISTLTIDEIQEEKEQIQGKEVYWEKTREGIITTFQNSNYHESLLGSEYEIYTYFDETTGTNKYNILKCMYDVAKEVYTKIWIYLPISILGLIMIVVYLFSSVGHKEGQEEIYLSSFDKIPTEIIIALLSLLYIANIWLTFRFANLIDYNYYVGRIIVFSFGFMVFYLISILTFVTMLRRLKAHTFLKNTICYFLIKEICEIFSNIRLSIRVVTLYALLWIATAILLARRSMIFLVVLWGGYGIYLIRRVVEYYKIRDFIEELYEGEKVEALKEEEFKGEFKKIVPKLNDIASGFSNAIEKGIQSERLKTELITNVSHDIKTPLTSIINYVDLMKKEEIQNEKVKEYLEVLDKKSQRLKKLTEDLVEASKASSGNIKLNKENLNVKELIAQEIGEFDERFQEKKLEIITNFAQEEFILFVDGKYMARVLDNIFSNISKYALPSSRVYIDIKKRHNKMELSFKNISANQLNITADELMERFVRGDVARTTEGSGLGLSIAKSLTELQGGTFEIYLDGDLFKVVITF